MLWKVRNKEEDQEGNDDGEQALEDEDPSAGGQHKSLNRRAYSPPTLLALDAVHLADTVCQQTAETRTQDAKGEKHGEAKRGLLAGVVLSHE
jgi:hypothetical protein